MKIFCYCTLCVYLITSPSHLLACQTDSLSFSISICKSNDLTEKEKADLIKKANMGDNKASYRLFMYYATIKHDWNIEDITQQPSWPWLRKAAIDGNVAAQAHLSQEYLWRIKNIELGLYWLKLSAKNGFEISKRRLEKLERILIGYQISESRPLPVPLSFDLTEAKKMELTEKANKNDNKASFLLFIYGEFYEHGGDNWLRDSAEDGNMVAQYILACDLEEKNEIDEAMRWLKLAADNGHEEAKKKLEKLKHELKIKSSEK
jgi:TPR repeat protein